MDLKHLVNSTFLPALVVCAPLIVTDLAQAHSDDSNDNKNNISVKLNGVINAMGEVCRMFEHGGVVNLEYSSQYPVNFNIHHHSETGTTFPIKHEGKTEHQDSFIAQPGREYCFMWENKTHRDTGWTVELLYNVVSTENTAR